MSNTKLARKARTWSAVAANMVKAGYYTARSWPMLASALEWMSDLWD